MIYFSKIILFVVSLITIWMSTMIIVRYPSNHGEGVGMYACFFIFVFVISVICYAFQRNGYAITSLIIATLGVIFVWVADRKNIMVDYDNWIKRGMPEWGEIGIWADAKQIETSKEKYQQKPVTLSTRSTDVRPSGKEN